jgi:hypothetical protein
MLITTSNQLQPALFEVVLYILAPDTFVDLTELVFHQFLNITRESIN